MGPGACFVVGAMIFVGIVMLFNKDNKDDNAILKDEGCFYAIIPIAIIAFFLYKCTN